MTGVGPQSNKLPGVTGAGPRRRHWLLAVGLVLAGSLLLAGNLGVLPAGLERVGAWGGPLLLVALGVWWVLTARSAAAAGLPSFAIERASFETAVMIAQTGTTDLEVRCTDSPDQLATGQFASAAGPGLRVRGTQAQIELSGRHAQPLVPAKAWAVALAQGLPWSLAVHSWTGDVDLDLGALTLDTLRLRSTFGDACLRLPATGQSRVEARLLTGNLHLRVPEELAVKIRVRRGPLANVQADERRFVQLAPGEWASPLFAVSANRCALDVDLWAGDLDVE